MVALLHPKRAGTIRFLRELQEGDHAKGGKASGQGGASYARAAANSSREENGISLLPAA